MRKIIALLLLPLLVVGSSLALNTVPSDRPLKTIELGPHKYLIDNAAPNLSEFAGQVEPLVMEERFAVFAFVGSNPKGDRVAAMFLVEPGEGGNRVWLFGLIYQPVESNETLYFFDMQFVNTGVSSFSLERVDKAPDLSPLIEIKKKELPKGRLIHASKSY